MQKYKQQILEPNPCSHHRKTPLLFCPHHSGCQKYRVFSLSKRRIIFRDAKRKRRRRGWGGGVFVYERAPQKTHRKKHCWPEPAHNASRLFPTDKEALVSPSPEREKKSKKKKTGDDLVPVALKKTGNRSRCERQ